MYFEIYLYVFIFRRHYQDHHLHRARLIIVQTVDPTLIYHSDLRLQDRVGLLHQPGA